MLSFPVRGSRMFALSLSSNVTLATVNTTGIANGHGSILGMALLLIILTAAHMSRHSPKQVDSVMGPFQTAVPFQETLFRFHVCLGECRSHLARMHGMRPSRKNKGPAAVPVGQGIQKGHTLGKAPWKKLASRILTKLAEEKPESLRRTPTRLSTH